MKRISLVLLSAATCLSLGCGSDPGPAPMATSQNLQTLVEQEDAAVRAQESQRTGR